MCFAVIGSPPITCYRLVFRCFVILSDKLTSFIRFLLEYTHFRIKKIHSSCSWGNIFIIVIVVVRSHILHFKHVCPHTFSHDSFESLKYRYFKCNCFDVMPFSRDIGAMLTWQSCVHHQKKKIIEALSHDVMRYNHWLIFNNCTAML